MPSHCSSASWGIPLLLGTQTQVWQKVTFYEYLIHKLSDKIPDYDSLWMEVSVRTRHCKHYVLMGESSMRGILHKRLPPSFRSIDCRGRLAQIPCSLLCTVSCTIVFLILCLKTLSSVSFIILLTDVVALLFPVGELSTMYRSFIDQATLEKNQG